MARPLRLAEQPRGREIIPETPRQRFQRIAPNRVAKAVKALRHLSQLGNPNVYSVTPKDREKILDVLEKETEQLNHALANPGKPAPVVQFDDDE